MADFKPLLTSTEGDLGLPAGLLTSVAKKESNFDPTAVNDKSNASGIMQIVPKWHPGVDPFNPDDAIPYAGQFLKDLHTKYNSWDKALAAYNWGPANVDKAVEKHGDAWLAHAPAETQDYVATITEESNPQTQQQVATDGAPSSLSATFTLQDGRKIPLRGTREEIMRQANSIRQEVEVNRPERERQEAIASEQDVAEQSSFAGMDLGVLGAVAARTAGGVGDVITSVVTGGLAEPIAGISGAAVSLFAGNDAGSNTVRAVRDAMTMDPSTAAGKRFMEDLAEPMMKIEEGADWVATKGSGGNPLAATAIKTGLLAAPDILGTRGLLRTAVPKQMRAVTAQAEKLGINLKQNTLRTDVVKAAKDMTPDEVGLALPALRRDLQAAKEASRQRVDAAYTKAREGRAFVDTAKTKGMAKGMTDELIEQGFDLEEMPKVTKTVKEIKNLATKKPGVGKRKTPVLTAQLRDFEVVRKRVNKRIASATDGSERAALYNVKNRMDDMLDDSFNEAAISGDPQAIKGWKDARAEHARYKKDFSEDRIVKNLLLDKEATPEMMSSWIQGASAMASKKEAARTIRRLKNIVGETNPAFEGMRKDYLLSVAEPLLRENPNFGGFINNYDRMIRKNPGVVKELGLNGSDMEQLRAFAKIADNVAPRAGFFDKGGLVGGVTRFIFGHQIARAAVRVGLARKFTNQMFGVDKITQREILKQLTEAEFGRPFVPNRRGVAAAEALMGYYSSQVGEPVGEE